MLGSSTQSTRLNGPLLYLARIAWVMIFLYSIGKVILGAPLYFSELKIVCTASQEVCSQRVGPNKTEAAELLEAGTSLESYARVTFGLAIFEAIIWIGTGAIIFTLRSNDWMALLVSATLIMFPGGSETNPLQQAYPNYAWLAEAGFALQNILLFLMIGLFPNGRFSPRWMRWYWLALIMLPIADMLLIPDYYDYLWAGVWISFLVLAPFSQIYRYKKVSTPVERIQTKWVVFGLAIFAGLLLSVFFLQQLTLLPSILLASSFSIFALGIPLGFGISILRYRLWDIDILIRRTLIYTALTLTLGLVFFGSITLVQSLLSVVSGQRSAIATALSTLIIAALFNPLRHRIQDGIDRRFFRRKYNAERVVEVFGARLRNEVDLDDISQDLLEAVAEALQPEYASLWIRPMSDVRRRSNDAR